MVRFGHISAKRCIFLMCDIQDKFRKKIPLFSHLVANAQRLTIAGKALDIPLLVGELCPDKYGFTVKKIDIEHACSFGRSQFSMITPDIEQEMRDHFEGCMPRDVVLYGLETHTSILLTALDLLNKKSNVFVVADCCLSRSNQDRDIIFQTLRDAGCVLTTAESLIYTLLRDVNNPKFKDLGKVLDAQCCDMDLSLNFNN